MSIFKADFQIRYSDVNYKNEISTATIMSFFQEMGCLHSQAVGMGLNQKQYSWLLMQSKLEVYKRPTWNEQITVHTWATGKEGPYCFRDFEMYNSKKELLAIGSSKWILVEIETQKIIKMTDEISNVYEPENKKVFVEKLTKLKEPETFEMTHTCTVQRKDIDTNQHMNNIKYIELAYETLPQDIYEEADLTKIEVSYKHASKLGDTLNCYYHKDGQTHYVTIKNNNEISAIVKLS